MPVDPVCPAHHRFSFSNRSHAEQRKKKRNKQKLHRKLWFASLGQRYQRLLREKNGDAYDYTSHAVRK